MKTLGERIRSIRGKRSREEFSKEYSIHPQSLGRYENDTRVPQDVLLDKISSGEGVSPEWIKFGTGQMEINLEVSSSKPLTCQRFFEPEKIQHTKNIESQKTSTSDVSEVLRLQNELAKTLREQNALIRENGDLRVDTERYKARIRDLEREVEALRKAMKPAAVPGMDRQGVA